MSTEVRHNTALDRFELHVHGELAGIAEYQDTVSERAFVHTEISPRYQDQGVGRALVEAALRATRDEGFRILPMCPMVRHIVATRAEYVALVPQWAREQMGLPR